LAGVSFDLRGGVTALVGPNGSGKSTLMRAVVGIGGWDSGAIAVDGVDLSRHPKGARRRVGYMPERISLPAEIRVESFLRFAARAKGLRSREANEAVEYALEAVGIRGEWRRRLVGNLSKGFRQRVGLGQAILGSPSLLVLDEPLSGLDPLNTNEVCDSIRRYAHGARGVLISTHQLNQARILADRVIVVSQGQILYDGPIGGMSLGERGAATVRIGLSGQGAGRIDDIFVAVGNAHVVDEASSGNGYREIRVQVGDEALVGDVVRELVQRDWRVRYVEPITDPLEVAFRRAVQGAPENRRNGTQPSGVSV
jgi:ABC-2 type transport system ATP-binding protein